MTCLFLLSSIFLVSCLAQDAGLYVNKIQIHGRYDADKKYTYFVDDNYDAQQTSDFTNEAPSIGRLYEDDYSENTQCTTIECPKLIKLYSYNKVDNGKITYTRIVDDAKKKEMGVTGGKAMGHIAPYPGYCNSDDSLPIVELYSAEKNSYAYWSPANVYEFFNINSTTMDTTRYQATRVLGYALSQSPARLVLEGQTPDFDLKKIAKNYTHSVFPLTTMVEVTKDGKYVTVGKLVDLNNYLKIGFTFVSNSFLAISPVSGSNGALMDTICGPKDRLMLCRVGTDSTRTRLFKGTDNQKMLAAGYTQLGFQAQLWTENRPACGGVKGLAELFEFKHKTDVERYTYANDPVKIAALLAGPWEKVADKTFGYVPLDTFGFMLFKQHIAWPAALP